MKIIKTILSLPLFYILYIGLYFVGNIIGGLIYTEIKASYLLAIPPAVLGFTYLFTLLHAAMIKWSKMNRYVYIISQILLIGWFTYLKVNTYIDYEEYGTSALNEKLNTFVFTLEMVISAIGIVLTFCVSRFWDELTSNTSVVNMQNRQEIAMYIIGGIFVIGSICLVILTGIETWNSSSFWTFLLSATLLSAIIPIVIGAIYGLGALYMFLIDKLLNKAE